MDKNTIIEKLRKLIYDYLDDEPEFNEDSLLNEDLGLSSLDLISVVLNSGTTTVWRDTKRLFAFGYGRF